MPTTNESLLLGRAPEQLSLDERRAFAGWWVALELYSPATLPERTIAAAAPGAAACLKRLHDRGRDPRKFELTVIQPPFR
ncbi:MAG TPA: hypothetical protein DEH78_08815 [Solibacterales bacterium]|nr:hypothetical protein [Bryobacterales bacterium]